MPSPVRSGLAVTPALTIPRAELTERFSRSSGPGGQGVNTTDSRVELSWDVGRSAVLNDTQRRRITEQISDRLVDGVLTVAASEHREQLRNRDAASRRLAALVADAVTPARTRRATRRTRGSQERRLTAKKQRSATKRMRSSRPRRDD